MEIIRKFKGIATVLQKLEVIRWVNGLEVVFGCKIKPETTPVQKLFS